MTWQTATAIDAGSDSMGLYWIVDLTVENADGEAYTPLEGERLACTMDNMHWSAKVEYALATDQDVYVDLDLGSVEGFAGSRDDVDVLDVRIGEAPWEEA